MEKKNTSNHINSNSVLGKIQIIGMGVSHNMFMYYTVYDLIYILRVIKTREKSSF